MQKKQRTCAASLFLGAVIYIVAAFAPSGAAANMIHVKYWLVDGSGANAAESSQLDTGQPDIPRWLQTVEHAVEDFVQGMLNAPRAHGNAPAASNADIPQVKHNVPLDSR